MEKKLLQQKLNKNNRKNNQKADTHKKDVHKKSSKSVHEKSKSAHEKLSKSDHKKFKSDHKKFMSDQEYLIAYQKMLLIRRFEEKAGQLYGMGYIGGFCHLYIGQEAIVQGVVMAKQQNDQMITGYRDHAHMLAIGCEPKQIMAELTGRAAGCSKGKGGSMHMFDAEKGFYGGHGIVAAQVPIGTGIALANKYEKNKKVSIVFFGDGAANQGQVYESFNIAALWKLPVIYVIENNQYAMGTSVERASSQRVLADRGISFNIPGEQVDGMNVAVVRQKTKEALDYARNGNGPYIIEMMSYRYRGHSMSDPAKYRSRSEVKEVREMRDPIENVRKYLLGENPDNKQIVSQEQFKEIDAEIRQIITQAAEFAVKTPEPNINELFDDVLARP